MTTRRTRTTSKTGSNLPDQFRNGKPTSEDDVRRRQALIAEHAYGLFPERDFTHGCDLDDWLWAEALAKGRPE